MVSSVFPFCPTSEISSLVPYSISHHFQTLHYCLSNSFFLRTFISISMLSLVPKPGELHSSGFQLLSVPRVKTHTGTHAFSVAVRTHWNSPSEHVKSSNSIVSFRHLPFQTRLSFLSFLAIWSFVDELCIVPRLWVCHPSTRCATELDSFQGYWLYRSFVIINYYYL